MSIKDKEVKIAKALKAIEHPEIRSSLFNLGMIKDLNIKEEKVTLTLKVPMVGIPIKDYLINDIKSAVKKEDENVEVEINMEEMDVDERTKFMKIAQDGWRGE
jgi:metal-sulfur cluster biosynthetic enzyme